MAGVVQNWTMERLKRHAVMLFPLAWPSITSRIGSMLLALVDTVMVGQYSTAQLAYFNLGSNSLVMFFIVVGLGLLMGSLVFAAEAVGREDYKEAGRVFRRSLPFAIVIGILCGLACQPGESLFLLMGQTESIAREGGRVMQVLGLGMPGYVLSIMIILYCEGLGRPRAGMYGVLLINILNVILNYGLIFGELGMPELGAVGSAWSTTITRSLLALGLLLYVVKAPGFQKYQIAKAERTPWTAWAGQRRMGYATAVSLGAEVAAFAMLSVLAGMVGEVALAAFGISFNVLAMVFMIGAGIGSATGVRVGMARGRKDLPDAALAGWTGLFIGIVLMTLVGLALNVLSEETVAFYSDDSRVMVVGAPVIAFIWLVIITDGGQAIMANALRGLGETWAPMLIQFFAYLVVMLPLSYYLALPLERGIMGLWEAAAIAGGVSLLLQGLRFHARAR